MSDVVIRAEGLGKKYVIGHESTERYTALRDVLAQQGRRLLQSARDMAAGRALIAGEEREEFWALKDVNFEIKRGEVVGIIGRNGAGKSTLLKVLSRITEPSEGCVIIEGRVASLLEVGTGFHPELTGRENIYLNGAILGMKRAEIRRKFDEIVDFAGVEKFLDTPVKRYSSGMYVRLAFSVAAHLEPEILVVDEVLAVGDAEFQRKCLGKMQDVAGHGRTVLFVSHNMAAVQALCSNALLLKSGTAIAHATTNDVISSYLTARSVGTKFGLQKAQRAGCEIIQAKFCEIIPKEKGRNSIQIEFDVFQELSGLRTGFILRTIRGEDIFEAYDTDNPSTERRLLPGKYLAECIIPNDLLGSGEYRVTINVGIPGQTNICHVEDCLTLELEGKHVDGITAIPRRGVCNPKLEWNRRRIA